MAKFGRAAAAEDLERVNVFKDAILNGANRHKVRPAVLAAIISRETRALPKFFIGDNGHGCGPAQIDDRSFPQICAEYKANLKTNEEMIDFGARVLRDKCMELRLNMHLKGERERIERAGIAAYNTGARRVAMALAEMADVDRMTTNKNYSSDVLERAAFFAENGF